MKLNIKNIMSKMGVLGLAAALVAFIAFAPAFASDIQDEQEWLDAHPSFELSEYEEATWTHEQMEVANEMEPVLEKEDGEPPVTEEPLMSFNEAKWTHEQMVEGAMLAEEESKEK